MNIKPKGTVEKLLHDWCDKEMLQKMREHMGSCKKCGTCCRWSYFMFNGPTKLSELLELRGGEQVTYDTIRVPLKCKHLDQLGNICLIYDKRPEACRNFPEDGEGIRPKECRWEEP